MNNVWAVSQIMYLLFTYLDLDHHLGAVGGQCLKDT